MVFARDRAVLERMRQLRGHGMTTDTRQRLAARAPTYDVTMLGWNYRMDEFRAAIGLVQLQFLRRWNEQRAQLARAYRLALAERQTGVSVPFSDGYESSHHILPAILPAGSDRDAVMVRMREAGIQTTVHYPPIHRMSFYRDQLPPQDLPMTEEFARRELSLPLHPKLEDSDVQNVVTALANALAC
jgi:dTDP-4-amino-4,6-dideoxygalactose transaminase